MAETYFCAGDYKTEDGGIGYFTSEFDPTSQKPDLNRCEYLKNYELSYDSCKRILKSDIESYNRNTQAYRQGKCYKYQTITHRYKTATCTAQYVVKKDGYSMKGVDSQGTKSEVDACFEQLKNRIIQTQNLLRSSDNKKDIP